MTKRKELWEVLRLILYIFGMFILFYLYFSLTDQHYSECITDNWCINSTDSPSAYSILWVTNIIVLVGSIYFSKMLTLWLIMKGWMLHALIVITVGLSSLGLFLYFTVVPPIDRIEFIHIPIIAAVIGAVGIALIKKLRSLQ